MDGSVTNGGRGVAKGATMGGDVDVPKARACTVALVSIIKFLRLLRI